MEVYVKKYFWVLTLATLAAAGFLAAQATSHLVEARLWAEPDTRPLAPPRPPRKPTPRAEPADHAVVATRNVFCSECTPPEPEPEVALTDAAPVKTALPIVLLATMLADDPAWSFAVLREDQHKESGLFRVGSTVLAAAEVTEIQARRVYLKASNGRTEYVDLEGFQAAEPAAGESESVVPAISAAPGESVGGLSGEELDASIKKVSENEYQVQRGLIDRVLGDLSAVGRMARIVPSVKDGKPNGFKIYAVRPGSLFSKIGLANGDTIHAINGHEITSPDKALEVYTKVRTASHINVSMTRRGEPRTLDYSIR